MKTIIDYISFTWSPESVEPLRKLARLAGKDFSKFIREYERQGQPLSLDRLEYEMVDCLKTFFMAVSRDFFANCEYSTSEAWEEHFNLLPRNTGVFGYKKAWDILIDETKIGIAATGATAGSCYISITGQGCGLIDPQRLYQILQVLPLVKITRIDLALDDFSGATGGFDAAQQAFSEGEFITRGHPPKCAIHCSGGYYSSEQDQIIYDGGRTFEVGSRQSGKLYRGYEKGKQQGDSTSKWFRHEIELRSSNREIPLQILLESDAYFVAFYPFLSSVFELVSPLPDRQMVIKTKKSSIQISLTRSVENAKRTVGGLVNVLRSSTNLTDSEILDRLFRDSVPIALKRALTPGLKQYQEASPCQL